MMNSLVNTSVSQLGFDQGMQARINANSLFSNGLSRGKKITFLKKLFGKQNELQALSKVEPNTKPIQKHGGHIVTISLEKIVGSEGRAHDFDKHFRPLVNHLRDRWVGIAVAQRRGIPLPPVELIQKGNEYYVRDGHHRISVAKTFGQATIEARIVYELA